MRGPVVTLSLIILGVSERKMEEVGTLALILLPGPCSPGKKEE